MKLFKSIGKFIAKNERVILTIVTIGAEAVAIYEGLKQGPKFEEILEKAKNDEITKKEAAKELAVPAIKVAVPFIISGGAAILNHKKASDTISSLANICAISRTVSDEYKNQVKKEVGEETESNISKNTDKALADRYVEGRIDHTIHNTGHGTDKLYDVFSDQWMYCDPNYINAVVNECNEEMLEAREYERNNPILLSDLYTRWGLPYRSEYDHFLFDHDTGIIRVDIQPAKGDDGRMYGIIKFLKEPCVVSYSSKRW